jgi:hypothetical protein
MSNDHEEQAEKLAKKNFVIILVGCVLYALAVFIFVL